MLSLSIQGVWQFQGPKVEDKYISLQAVSYSTQSQLETQAQVGRGSIAAWDNLQLTWSSSVHDVYCIHVYCTVRVYVLVLPVQCTAQFTWKQTSIRRTWAIWFSWKESREVGCVVRNLVSELMKYWGHIPVGEVWSQGSGSTSPWVRCGHKVVGLHPPGWSVVTR